MPDVTRSDSQRSDASNRPRVSFNRDVHVKRIVPREGGRIVGALSADGAGHLVASPVRKERLKRSKKELAEEAARVIHQADKLDCVVQDKGVLPEKFYTLPNRKKQKPDFISSSLDRREYRRGSLELVPPKKPPRTFATVSSPQSNQKASIFDIFKREKKQEPKKSNLRRSVSDATNLKSRAYGVQSEVQFRKRSGSDTEENSNSRSPKKQLSPIIEVTNREDYFSQVKENDKENIKNDENVDVRAPARKKGKKSQTVTEKLKEYIDEVDEEIYKETGVRVTPPADNLKEPEVIIIDVDKAEKITKTKNKNSIGKKLRSLTHKKNKTNEAKSKLPTGKKKPDNNKKPVEEVVVPEKPKLEEKLSSGSVSTAPKIKEAIENLENSGNRSPTMIHSSQKPVDKLPLTKGRTVGTMVKRLSTDSTSPPPKTNILITPNASMQHNNNQPFSYTRGLSPEKYMSNENLQNPGSPIIYAQVVCGKNGTTGPAKQTVHTAYQNGKKHPHSDSDEGLGYEENTAFNSRKYESEKPITHFGDNRYNRNRTDDFFDDGDKFEEESPITPKFTNPAFMNGYSRNAFARTEQSAYVDSSSRGRGDGMDSKRRESLTEPFENGFNSTMVNGNGMNGRSDLSARRDLLESRINRRLNDKSLRHSPEFIPTNTPPTNIYISESSSKYYRSGSTSPVGYKEKYVSETRTDKKGERYTTESRSKKYFGDHPDNRHNGNNYNSFENEPKSFDSQISDYRSSPENRQFETSHNISNNRYNAKSGKQKIFKDRDLYKSTPEIHQRNYVENQYRDSYHDSLRREKHENKLISSTKYRSERYLDHSESERKDKFGDSGIENDFRRDSADNFRGTRAPRRREYCNESEDEGFASSLLIASERQHTEDNINNRKRRDYDSDRPYLSSREDDPYRNIEHLDYKSKPRSNEYIPRERSIDDGSHFDPRIDKDIDRSTLKKTEKKPPKPEKKSSLERMKQLFTRDSKKKKEKQQQNMVREESLRARYVEYKGRDIEPRYKKKEISEENMSYDYSNRRRLSTPSPSPTRDTQRNGKPETTHGSWFKSLDRLSRKKTKKDERDGNLTSTEEEIPSKPTPTKNLRFFGDTDIESNDSTRQKPSYKVRPGIINRDRTRSQSTRDLHNISEEMRTPDLKTRKSSHKSMLNISETDRDLKGSKMSLKPPMSPNHRVARDVSKNRDDRGRRRKNEVSSVESSTEGDSSQQSQRSIVYLHAATVGDIPGPGYLRNGRRAASREELASNSSSRIQPQVKTLSRSFSVLAPWKPKHYREGMDIDYTQYQKPTKNGKYEQKVSKNGSSRKENSSTLKKKAQETRRNQNMSTLNRKSKSKENLASSQNLRKSNGDLSKGSSSTLYKKKEKLPRENSRYNRDRDDKKFASKSLSVESLGSNGRSGRRSREERDISRSVSMPRDPEKSAGWFKMTKKSKTSGSTQRL